MTFEDLYKHEIEQRGRLNSELSLPLGLLIAIGSLLGVMLQSAWFKIELLTVWFYLSVLAAGVFFAATMYFLVRSYHGHVYSEMPFALELREYRDALRQWYQGSGGSEEAAEREWRNYLEDSYSQAADHNANVNLVKSEYLFRARGAVVWCAVSTVIAFAPYAIHRALSPAPPERIEIINQGKITGSKDSMPNQVTTTQSGQGAQALPPKPQAPPLRTVKEGSVPKKK